MSRPIASRMRIEILARRAVIYRDFYDPQRKRTSPRAVGRFTVGSILTPGDFSRWGIEQDEIPGFLALYRRAQQRQAVREHGKVLYGAPESLLAIARALSEVGTRDEVQRLAPALAAVRDALSRFRRLRDLEEIPIIIASDRPDTETLPDEVV